MKVYKIELFIIDFDHVGADGIKDVIEDTHYPNRCISPKVKKITEKDIGEWDDSHPLNKLATCEQEYLKLFP